MCKEWFLILLLIPTFLFLIFTRILSYFQKLFLSDWNQLSDGLESKHLGLVSLSKVEVSFAQGAAHLGHEICARESPRSIQPPCPPVLFQLRSIGQKMKIS